MISNKVIVVGIPGSGITDLNDSNLAGGVSKLFTTASSEDIDNMYLKDYMVQHTQEEVDSIYNNEYYVTMYNSISPGGNMNTEGVSLSDWDENKFIILTPYEFINIPQSNINNSIIVHMDCNYKYIYNNYPDHTEYYKQYITNKYSCNKTFMDMCNNTKNIYFFNEPVDRVLCICNLLSLGNDTVDNILLKGLNK